MRINSNMKKSGDLNSRFIVRISHDDPELIEKSSLNYSIICLKYGIITKSAYEATALFDFDTSDFIQPVS